MIPYGRQQISEEDIEAVVEVLRSNFLTQGDVVPKFEKAVCEYTGTSYGIAVNSGTSALHLACLALGLGEGDTLWTSPITFVASANCALYCGAKVDFVDIDPETFNMCEGALSLKLEKAEREGRLPKVVIPVHFGGLPCDMEVINQLAEKYKFHVIEDACHAIGGRYKNNPIGSCSHSVATVFSFHPVKNMTTGEGGMVVTNNRALASKIALLRGHGITRSQADMTHESDGDWYYQQIDLGFNYRMTDLQAALGISQLKRLDSFVARRHEIAELYDEGLSGVDVKSQCRTNESYSGQHLYVIRLQDNKDRKNHRLIFEELRRKGIGVNLHYIPVHMQPWYLRMGFKQGDFVESEEYYKDAISLPMYQDLSDIQVQQVIDTLKKVLND